MKRRICIAMVLALIDMAPARAAWTFKVESNPMTDAKRGISLLLGDAGGLAIKCDQNGRGSLYLSFISTKYLGGMGWRKNRALHYRIDKGEVNSISADHNGSTASVLDVSPNSDGGRLLSALRTSHQLAVQLTDYDNQLQTIVFDTTGAREAIAQSAAACGDDNWSVP